jgi:hypothetical protein
MALPTMASAGNSTGYVSNIITSTSTTAGYTFSVSGPHNDKPSPTSGTCEDAWYIPNPTTDKAKTQLALIMTAYATQRQVYIVGNGVCDDTVKRESVTLVNIY